jgi:hypothetical protein
MLGKAARQAIARASTKMTGDGRARAGQAGSKQQQQGEMVGPPWSMTSAGTRICLCANGPER